MKQSIREIFFALVTISVFGFVQTTRAQVGMFVPKDERIARFQKEILQYLVKEKQFRGSTSDEITLERYQDRMIVRRRLEIYTDSSVNDILLIKFQADVDHCDKFWGVLTQNRSYLFYDFADPQFQLLRKELTVNNVKLIRDYCEINSK
jgi:hypothetical protein